MKAEAPFVMGGNSNADSNGLSSAAWVSPALFRENFIVAGDMDWVAIASENPIDVEVVNLGTGAVEETITMTGTADFNIFRHYWGPNNGMNEGRLLRAVNPGDKFIMWYQPGPRTSYQEQEDETLSFGFDN